MGPDRSDAFSIITDKENADKKTNLETDIHSSINSMNGNTLNYYCYYDYYAITVFFYIKYRYIIYCTSGSSC